MAKSLALSDRVIRHRVWGEEGMEPVMEDRSLATKTSHKAMSPAPSSMGKTAEEVSETQTALEEVRDGGHIVRTLG